MPIEKTHEDKKVKNYLILGLLLLFVIAVFAVTIVKLDAAGEKLRTTPTEEKTPQQ